jgi:hypothetical protein
MPHKPNQMITNLPTDVLSCIIQHLQGDGCQRTRALDDIAALRSTCRSLRLDTDLRVMHARFHANIDAPGLRSMIRRCAGDTGLTSLQLQACSVALQMASAECRQCASIFHKSTAAEITSSILLTTSQVCKPSRCITLGPTPRLGFWKRLRLYNTYAASTCREQDPVTTLLHACCAIGPTA